MTVTLGDYAQWQETLTPADFVRAGLDGINFKTSHGLGQKSVHPKIVQRIAEARALRMPIASFHYLTAEGSGRAQAEYAYSRLVALGLQHNTVHQVDCEADATYAILTEYVTTMRKLLGRPVVIYSADWWWIPRGWAGSTLSPYVWSAPNTGYTTGYPGDTSPLWACGWGGWPTMAILQYEVGPLRYPGGSTSGDLKVSKSAIRDLAVWAALAGGQMTQPVCDVGDLEQFSGATVADPWLSPQGWPVTTTLKEWRPELPPGMPRAVAARAAWLVVPALNALLAELNDVAPDRDKSSDGSIGDTSHSARPSGHNPDETGSPEDTDSDSINEVRARDFDKDLNRPGLSMEMVAQYLVAECRAGRITWIKYLIFNKRIWRAATGWVTQVYTGSNPHDHHMHVSCKSDTTSENTTRKVGLASLLEEDEFMAFIENRSQFQTELTAWAETGAGRNALAVAVLAHDPGKNADGSIKPGGVANPGDDAATNPTIGPGWALNRAAVSAILAYQIRDRADAANRALASLATTVGQVLAKVTQDDGDRAAIEQEIAEVQTALAGTPQATVDALGASDASPEEKAALLRAALGADAVEVGQLLAAG